MDPINVLGLVAGSLTTVAFVPQVLKTWRSKSGDDISYAMFPLFATGVLLLLYGIALHATPIIVANAITLALTLAVLALKRRYQRRPPSPLTGVQR